MSPGSSRIHTLWDGWPRLLRDNWLIGPEPFKTALSGTALIGLAGDERGRILAANRDLADLLGTPVEDLAGASMFDFIHEEHRERALRELARLIGGVIGWHDSEWRALAADGGERRLRVQASIVSRPTGNVLLARVSPC